MCELASGDEFGLACSAQLRHALRPALGPLVTLTGLDLGVLLGGAVVTEFIVAWPGLGRDVHNWLDPRLRGR